MAWKSLDENEINNTDFENDGEFWNPEPNDTLQGTVQVVKEGQYNKLFLVLEDEAGDVWITTQCAGLHKQIQKLEIKQGDLIHLTYNGRADDEYGSHQYLLQVWEEGDD